MKAVDNKHIKLRVIVVGVLFSVFFTAIGAKAVYLQIFCGPRLSQKAANQYEKSFKSSGKRGAIYDANLTEMAVSVEVTSIAAHPEQMVDIQSTAKTLAKLLTINRGQLLRKLTSNRKFVWIKRHVAPREARAVRDLNLAGLDFITECKRFYPNKTLAAPLLGFTNVDDNGLEGLEFYYDNYLKGASTNVTVLMDALGRGFNQEETQMPNYNGHNLILTIDRTIQYIAEKALEESVTKFSAKSGMAIVMAPKTGALLAAAQYPFFNPNTYADFNRELWRNQAITDPFEPGSTMKIFSVAAALESGRSSLKSTFYCENGTYKIGKDMIHDTHPYAWLTLEQVVKLSSNIGAVKVTEVTGPERLYKTLQDFGFGAKTGIDCPGESAGSLSPYRRWSKIDAGTIAFGQGISASALQLITATAAIANDGILMKPYIVQAITDENGRLIQTFGPQKIRRAVSSATVETIIQILQTVTQEGGTGVSAALEGYSACGKTGTAQKIEENGEYSNGKYIGSFVGFAPAEKPAVVILVVIDEPRKAHYGGVVAAPAFREIAHKTLNYLNIPPKNKTDRLTAAINSEA